MHRFSLITLFFTGFLFSACFSDQQTNESACVVKWQLIEISGSRGNELPVRGEDLNYQESYTLRVDSTFIKEQKADRQRQASGRYKFIETGGEQFIEFNYYADNDIIGSCYGDTKEILLLLDGKLYGTVQACDGPGLIYERETINCED
jgi:hypothetical protein